MDKQGETDSDVKTRISKTRGVFLHLRIIWSSSILSQHTKIEWFDCLFNSNVKVYHQHDPDFCQPVSTHNPLNPLARYHKKHRSMEADQPEINGWRDFEKEVVWGWLGHKERGREDHLPVTHGAVILIQTSGWQGTRAWEQLEKKARNRQRWREVDCRCPMLQEERRPIVSKYNHSTWF